MAIVSKRALRREEEGESIFVSMTDLAVSFLFILLVLLAFFATQIHLKEAEKEIQDPLATYLQSAASQRERFLKDIKRRIEHESGIKVTVFTEEGLIRLAADEFFESGKWEVGPQSNPEAYRIAEAIADAFMAVLPSYTLGSQSRYDSEINPVYTLIETVQIEGHTDSDPIMRSRGELIDNLDLSSRRAAAMFRVIQDKEPRLLELFNLKDFPVMSFSGYGDLRPLPDKGGLSEDEIKRRNRRIDLRFILQTPRDVQEIESIKDALRQSGAELRSNE